MSYGTYQPLPLSEVLAHAIRCAEGDQNVHKRYYLALDDLRRIQTSLATLPEDAGLKNAEAMKNTATWRAHRLHEIVRIIETVDARAMAHDGDVPSTMQEMHQVEMSRIYDLARGVSCEELHPAAPATGQEG